MKKTIGVLSLQGGFESHLVALSKLCEPPYNYNIAVKKVRYPKDLEICDALILPGGESTTIGRLLESVNMLSPLAQFAKEKPVFGTCAGMIILAKMGSLHVEIERNAYGSQSESFTTTLIVALPQGEISFEGIFIRAPKIINHAKTVSSLSKYLGTSVLVEEDNIMAASFHPELTQNLLLHKYFVEKIYS